MERYLALAAVIDAVLGGVLLLFPRVFGTSRLDPRLLKRLQLIFAMTAGLGGSCVQGALALWLVLSGTQVVFAPPRVLDMAGFSLIYLVAAYFLLRAALLQPRL